MDAEGALGIAGQVVILIGAGFGALRWLRRWLVAQVKEPIEEVDRKVDDLSRQIAALSRKGE